MINKNKRKILVLIPHFLPGYKMGGPLTSIINMIDKLSPDYYFEILTSDRDMGDDKPYDNIKFNVWIKKSNYNIYYVNSDFLMLFRLIKCINSSSVDIVYLNSLFNPVFSIFVVFANKMGLLKAKKIILSPRGETYDEALDFKKNKKRLFLWLAKKINLYKNIYWHASTEVEKKFVIKNMKVDSKMIHVALNLSQITSINEIDLDSVVPRHNKEGLHIVFLSRISKDKNIVFTFDILKEIKTKVVFHIYGPIEDLFIWELCKEKILNLPSNIVVEYKGTVPKDKVKKVFSEYDLMFLPTFAENFGHVIVESLSVGTPVLLSDNTPWRELESAGFGWDLPLNKPELFIKAIEIMSNLSEEEKIKNKAKVRKDILMILNNPETLDANRILFE